MAGGGGGALQPLSYGCSANQHKGNEAKLSKVYDGCGLLSSTLANETSHVTFIILTLVWWKKNGMSTENLAVNKTGKLDMTSTYHGCGQLGSTAKAKHALATETGHVFVMFFTVFFSFFTQNSMSFFGDGIEARANCHGSSTCYP